MQFLPIVPCAIFNILYNNAGVAAYLVYYKYMNHDKENISKYDYVYQVKNY